MKRVIARKEDCWRRLGVAYRCCRRGRKALEHLCHGGTYCGQRRGVLLVFAGTAESRICLQAAGCAALRAPGVRGDAVRNGVGKRLLLNGSAVATCWVIGVGAGLCGMLEAGHCLRAGGLQSAAGVGCRGVGRCYGRLRKATEGGGSHWCDFLTPRRSAPPVRLWSSQPNECCVL